MLAIPVCVRRPLLPILIWKFSRKWCCCLEVVIRKSLINQMELIAQKSLHITMVQQCCLTIFEVSCYEMAFRDDIVEFYIVRLGRYAGGNQLQIITDSNGRGLRFREQTIIIPFPATKPVFVMI